MKRPRIRRDKNTPRVRRGIYIIPSLFTVANIFCGFLSIIAASRDQFERSAVLILVAILTDVLDGRIARLTGTTSSFGEAYDSLADVVSFGMAPALLAFRWGLWAVPRVGMAVAFLFLVAGSIRLARFSASTHAPDHFVGLPIPAGAAAISMLVLLSPSPVTHPGFIPVVIAFVLGLSLLMVSNLPYPADKGVHLRRKWPATTLFLIALAFSLITLTPHVLSVLLAIYLLSAPVAVLTGKARRRTRPEMQAEAGEGDTSGSSQSTDH